MKTIHEIKYREIDEIRVSPRQTFHHLTVVFALLVSVIVIACSHESTPPGFHGTQQPVTFPASSEWIVAASVKMAIGDVATDDQNGNHEIVGEPAFPPIFWRNDGRNLFFRLRLDSSPLKNTRAEQLAWGILFDTDGALSDHEYSLFVRTIGRSGEIVYGHEPRPGDLGQPSDTAETTLATFPLDLSAAPDHNVEVHLADSCFGGSMEPGCAGADPERDFFLDFSVPLTVFATEPALDLDGPLQIMGSTSSCRQSPSVDVARCDDSVTDGPQIQDGVSDTILFSCGDGSLDHNEGCDDGGNVDGDGCSATCLIEDTFPCNLDPNGATDDPSCASGICDISAIGPSICVPPPCGNGALEIGEGCDDGNKDDGDGCNSVCHVEDGNPCNDTAPGDIAAPSCASGICDLTECSTGICEPADSCDNRVLEAGEGCDDGNAAPGDGCNDVCLIEDGHTCNDDTTGNTGDASCASGLCDTRGAAPGVCIPPGCSNGVLEAGEGCDDGNATGGDGCSELCLVENGGTCNNDLTGLTVDASCTSGLCDDDSDTCVPQLFISGGGCDAGSGASGGLAMLLLLIPWLLTVIRRRIERTPTHDSTGCDDTPVVAPQLGDRKSQWYHPLRSPRPGLCTTAALPG